MVAASVITEPAQAFTTEWIAPSGRAYVSRYALDPVTAVRLVTQAGGAADRDSRAEVRGLATDLGLAVTGFQRRPARHPPYAANDRVIRPLPSRRMQDHTGTKRNRTRARAVMAGSAFEHVATTAVRGGRLGVWRKPAGSDDGGNCVEALVFPVPADWQAQGLSLSGLLDDALAPESSDRPAAPARPAPWVSMPSWSPTTQNTTPPAGGFVQSGRTGQVARKTFPWSPTGPVPAPVKEGQSTSTGHGYDTQVWMIRIPDGAVRERAIAIQQEELTRLMAAGASNEELQRVLSRIRTLRGESATSLPDATSSDDAAPVSGDVPTTETPYLDSIEAELREVSPGLEGSVWERTSGNALDASLDDPDSWILQVPDVWGWSPEDLGPQGMDKPGVRALLAKVQANIAQAEHSVDITGFGILNIVGMPAGQFPDGPFLDAIGAGLKTAAAAAAAAGRRLKVRVLTGVLNIDVTVSPWSFRDRLKKMIGADFRAVDINVAAMTTRGATSFNHTKFVVVDGMSAIHGGINWMKNFYIEDGSFTGKGYGGVAPITDLDMALRGPAATSAGKFLDVLWAWTSKNASTWRRLGVGAWLATNNDKLDESIPNLYAGHSPTSVGDLQVLSVGSLGYGIQKNDPSSTYQPPPADDIDQAATKYGWWGSRSNNETNTDRDFMTVNPDANALRALVATAKKKIVLSQQDIIGFVNFPLNHALFDVRLIDVLAAKMTAENPVKVRIVLSNPGAPDTSNIDDIKVPAKVLFDRIRLRTASDADARRVMEQNLQLALLRVSDQPTWPTGYKYRLHTKVVSVDDKAFYIGSRNAYPDTTQDHGFILEDATAAQQLNTKLLDKQWQYSKKAAIFDWERTLDATDSATGGPPNDDDTPPDDNDDWLAGRIERALAPERRSDAPEPPSAAIAPRSEGLSGDSAARPPANESRLSRHSSMAYLDRPREVIAPVAEREAATTPSGTAQRRKVETDSMGASWYSASRSDGWCVNVAIVHRAECAPT